MNQSGRKLLGTLGLIVLLVVYPLVITALLGGWLATLPGWVSIPIFVVLGLAWFLPAAWVVRWMGRPSGDPSP